MLGMSIPLVSLVGGGAMGARRMTRDEARARTREAILVQARRLFESRGYRGASLEDIAEAAGFSKGAVYSNWAGKEALFLDLLDREAQDGGAGDSALATEATGWALATLDFFLEAVHNPETRAALGERYRQARQGAGAAIAQGRPNPPWANWEEVASVVMALGSGLIIQSAVDEAAVDPTLMQRAVGRLLGDTQE
jgi:AcrR family transcriptional regulator